MNAIEREKRKREKKEQNKRRKSERNNMNVINDNEPHLQGQMTPQSDIRGSIMSSYFCS